MSAAWERIIYWRPESAQNNFGVIKIGLWDKELNSNRVTDSPINGTIRIDQTDPVFDSL